MSFAAREPKKSIVLALRAVVLAAGLLPWILALARARSPAVMLAFASLCHQMPERTLTILGTPMAVCSRCAGIYAGVALGALFPLPHRMLGAARAILLTALGLMVADVVTQDLGLHAPFHPVRVGTGLLVGWIASAWMTRALLREESRPSVDALTANTFEQ